LDARQNKSGASIQSSKSITVLNATIIAHPPSSQCFGFRPSVTGSFSLAISDERAPYAVTENFPYATLKSYLQVGYTDLSVDAACSLKSCGASTAGGRPSHCKCCAI
jgi:hypothetical protein